MLDFKGVTVRLVLWSEKSVFSENVDMDTLLCD